MAEAVRQERAGAVAVLVIDAGPVNALGQQVRAGLLAGIEAAEADPSVKALVIRAAGRAFSAGADIAEFGAAPVAPSLPDLCNHLEMLKKPVIAAVHGAVLGGGLELALAAHVRISAADARLGFPEVALGILPGAGGTQRAPRLVGAEQALRMMLTGRPVGAAEALAMGLIDGVVEDGLTDAAVALAADLAADGAAPRPTRARTDGMRDPMAYQAAIAAARAEQAGGRLPAPERIIECVDAALVLPFEQGLTFERAAFEDLVTSPESAGLRHVFMAERRAARFPEAAAPPRPADTIGIVGLGRMGSGIAVSLLAAGAHVTAVETDREALIAGLGRVAELQERAVLAGRMTEAARDADWARISPGSDLASLAGMDLVIEAVPEDFALKASVLRDLAAVLRPGAVMAVQTAWLDPATLAEASGRAADVIGLQFGLPVQATALVEVAAGPATAPAAVATGMALARRMGKQPVRVAMAAGLVGKRVQGAMRTAADFLLEDGATPMQVDAALRDFGFAQGPYQAQDIAGLEQAWAERLAEAPGRDPARRYAELGDLLVEAGRLGLATGRGYHLYDQGTAAREDPEVLALLAELRAAKGIVARRVGAEEIRRRCLAAMANEGARLLAAGVALRPSDIDVAMVAGHGFPRWEGGPMFWAARRGLIVLRADLRNYAEQSPEFWQVAPLIDDLIRDGRSLADLDTPPAQPSRMPATTDISPSADTPSAARL